MHQFFFQTISVKHGVKTPETILPQHCCEPKSPTLLCKRFLKVIDIFPVLVTTVNPQVPNPQPTPIPLLKDQKSQNTISLS